MIHNRPRLVRCGRPGAPIALVLTVLAGLVAVVTSCTGTARNAQSFCDQLIVVTGPQGAEVALAAGDPARLDAIVIELELLLERAPDDISTTVLSVVEFFQSYQLAPREERRELIVENEEELAAASKHLDEFALSECGLFLQRAIPTPIATSNPGIEVLPE